MDAIYYPDFRSSRNSAVLVFGNSGLLQAPDSIKELLLDGEKFQSGLYGGIKSNNLYRCNDNIGGKYFETVYYWNRSVASYIKSGLSFVLQPLPEGEQRNFWFNLLMDNFQQRKRLFLTNPFSKIIPS